MRDIVKLFYQSFAKLDAESMVNCYHDDVLFEDPAFGILKGSHAKNMWRMLCESQKGKNFIITSSNIVCNKESSTAHWEAQYIFSKTGRKVHNKIDTEFIFKDGKIIQHTDHFNLHFWARQAIGFKGILLGGTNF